MQGKWAKDDENEVDEKRLVKNFKNISLSDAELNYLLKRVTGYIRRRYTSLSSEADDIASEAVIRACKKIDSLQDEAKFFGWVKGIARHIALEQIGEAKQLPVHSRDAAWGYTNDESPEEVEALQEQAGFDDEAWLRTGALKEALALLSEEQQAVITLRIDEQHSAQEVGEMLGKSDANVRQIEFRACRKMHEYLVSSGYADLFPSRPQPKKRPSIPAPVKTLTSLPASA